MTKLLFGTAMLASCLMLANCGASKEAEKAEAAEPAARSSTNANDASLEPGLWRMSMEILNVEIPGAPPELAAMMAKEMKTAGQSEETCMTPEQAKNGLNELTTEMQKGGACTTTEFRNENGQVNAKLTCGEGADGGVMTMTGNFSRTSLDMTMTAETKGEDAMGAAKISMSMKGERVGDCPG